MAGHQVKVNPAWPECAEEWETHGGYMAAKKSKLEEQFHEAAKSEFSEATSIFRGVAIFVNGYTDPPAEELKRLMMAHGGVYHYYLRSQKTTHMIATNLPYSKIVAYRKAQKPLPLCKPEWIMDSIKAGKLLDYRNYQLYSQCTKNQPAIFAHLKKKTAEKSETITSNSLSTTLNGNAPNSVNASTSTVTSNLVSTNLNGTSAKASDVSSVAKPPATTISENPSMIQNSTKNPEFLTEFYNNSRLHHISTMGAMFKDYINELRDKSDGKFPGLEALKRRSYEKLCKPGPSTRISSFDSEEDLFENLSGDPEEAQDLITSKEKKPVIMHIDMDCFFVSVGLRDHPELRGLPVAVAHAKGNKKSDSSDDLGSMSEVASCSYEARKAGVKNGMFLGKALKLCPNLKTIRYNFDAYKEVSYCLYDTVASYTMDIEAVSCDEMYVDCTKILQSSDLTPMEFAAMIRNEIKEKTNCPVSTGFGENKLQARIATKKAKPNGQYHLKGNNILSVIRGLNVRDLPGVGYSTSQKLNQMNVKTCGDLEAIPLYELQKEFGKKTGQQLHEMCRGIDHSKLSLEHIRKSVSAEVNYGIRFENNEAAYDFLRKLSEEVSDRLKKINSKSKCVTLKVMFRAKDAPKETRKFMGHGVCDAYNKSKNLVAPTDDPVTIAREVISLWNQFLESPDDARGIGIQMTKLESSKNKTGGNTLLKFFDRNKASDKNVNHDVCKTNDGENSKSKKNDFNQLEENFKDSETKQREKFINHNALDITLSFEDELGEIDFDRHDAFQIHEKEDIQPNANDFDFNSDDLPNDIEPNIGNQINGIQFDKESSNRLEDDRPPKEQSSKDSSQMKQTKQSEYFKKVKPSSSNKSGKVILPNIQEIDMKVLIELPEDIRNEVLNAYKENKNEENEIEESEEENLDQGRTRENHGIKPPENIITKRRSSMDTRKEKEISFSQVDPEFLAALPDEVKNEVKSYCDANKRQRVVQQETKNSASNGWNMFKVDKKPQKDTKVKSGRGRGRGKGGLNVKGRKDINTPKTNLKSNENFESNREKDKVEQLNRNPNDQLRRPEEESLSANKSFYFDSENGNSEHTEILSDLVKCLLELPLAQVKKQIHEWIVNSTDVNDVDFLSMTTFLGALPRKRRLTDLFVLLKCLHRNIEESENCIWHETYKKMLSHIQPRMRLEYGCDIMIPESIECDKCNSTKCDKIRVRTVFIQL